MVVHPSVEVKAIEADALGADRDFNNVLAHFGIEPVAVHAKVGRRIAKANDTRLNRPAIGLAPHRALPSCRMVTQGERPRLRIVTIRPAPSKESSARYLALRSTPKRKERVLLR